MKKQIGNMHWGYIHVNTEEIPDEETLEKHIGCVLNDLQDYVEQFYGMHNHGDHSDMWETTEELEGEIETLTNYLIKYRARLKGEV